MSSDTANNFEKPIVIGIAGGSGSGKTTVAEMIAKDLGEDRVTLVFQDNYYKDLRHLEPAERAKVNFDHPDSIDAVLMGAQMNQLKNGSSIQMPVYDFKTHIRHKETLTIKPKEILIIEGILVLDSKELRNLMDIKIYVDTDDDIRFIRRLRRDIVERGREIDSVIDQYLSTVRPMHLEFVEKSKRYADIILPWRDFNTAAVSMVIKMVRGFIELEH
jgi:uridine kinase